MKKELVKGGEKMSWFAEKFEKFRQLPRRLMFTHVLSKVIFARLAIIGLDINCGVDDNSYTES